jgi:hypothetical protein
MTRSYGLILGAMAGCMFLLVASSALHAQTMGEYGTAMGSQMSSVGSQTSTMGAGVDMKIGSSIKAAQSNQPVGDAHMIEVPRGAVHSRVRTGRRSSGRTASNPSSHEWVRVK